MLQLLEIFYFPISSQNKKLDALMKQKIRVKTEDLKFCKPNLFRNMTLDLTKQLILQTKMKLRIGLSILNDNLTSLIANKIYHEVLVQDPLALFTDLLSLPLCHLNAVYIPYLNYNQ